MNSGVSSPFLKNKNLKTKSISFLFVCITFLFSYYVWVLKRVSMLMFIFFIYNEEILFRVLFPYWFLFFLKNILYDFSFPFKKFPVFSLFHNVPYNHDESVSKKHFCFEGFPKLTESYFNQLCDGEASCLGAIAPSTPSLSIPSYVFTSTSTCPLLAIV